MKFFVLIFLLALSSVAFAIKADFTASVYSGCPPLVADFTDNSTGNIIEWYWNFGNGNFSDKPNPSAEFLTSGTYHVKLIVTDNTGAKDSVVKNIRIFKIPIVDFTASKTLACLGTPITFQSLVTLGDAPVNDYGWGLGNGIAQSDSNTVYTYGATGSYNITLVVQDTNGCAANKTRTDYITIIPAPQAAFTASPAISCDSIQLVKFTNQSTGLGLSYSWTLADSVTSTLQNPTYTYTEQQQTVVLTITDTSGCISKTTQSVSTEKLVAKFSASSGGSKCAPSSFSINNESTVIAGTTYNWNFGDGTTSTSASPAKSYAASGIYDITLVVKNGSCFDSVSQFDTVVVTNVVPPIPPTFTADSTVSCTAPLTVHFTNTSTGSGYTYSWSFSNGDTSDSENPTITFDSLGNYSVQLTAIDTNTHCKISGGGVNIHIGPPIPKFLFSDTINCAGSGIQFVNTSSGGTSYQWAFSNGYTSSETSPSFMYPAGVADVSVTLTTNGPGCDSSVSASFGPPYLDTMHVNFNVLDTFSPCPPFACVLQNESSGGVAKYLWKFGDGYTDARSNPTHIYFYPGLYSITLIGWNASGCVDSIVYPDVITVQGPTGVFTAGPPTGCAPFTVSFTDSVSANTKNFWCDLGDGNIISDSFGFAHTYTQARSYYPQFVLVDHVGCTVPYNTDSIIVHSSNPFHVNDTAVCAGVSLNVSLSQNGNQYKWSPPVFLSCDTCANVAINDTGNTSYQITGTNQFGCVTGNTMRVTVVPLPQLSDTTAYSLCNLDTLALFVGNAAKIIWSPGLYLSDSASVNPLCTAPVSITYTVNAFNSLGCMVSTQVPVTEGSKVSFSLPGDTTICEDSSIELSSKLNFASSVGIHYSWSPASYLNDAGIASPVATLSNSEVQFQLIVTSGHCVPDTETITVSAAAMPDIAVSPPVLTTPYAQVQLFAESHQELTYRWSDNDSMTCTDENCSVIYIYPSASETVNVTGTNKYGCMVKDEIPINVMGCDAATIYLPNTFTPNGDGVDDKFLIRSKTLTNLTYFRIFDQWGQMVFETNRLDEGWDGTITGKPAPIAVYVYELEGKCANGYEVMKQGNVTALR